MTICLKCKNYNRESTVCQYRDDCEYDIGYCGRKDECGLGKGVLQNWCPRWPDSGLGTIISGCDLFKEKEK